MKRLSSQISKFSQGFAASEEERAAIQISERYENKIYRVVAFGFASE